MASVSALFGLLQAFLFHVGINQILDLISQSRLLELGIGVLFFAVQKMSRSQRPPAKPEAWQRWSGPRPHSPAGDDSTSLPNPCVISSRFSTRKFRTSRIFIRLLCFTTAPDFAPLHSRRHDSDRHSLSPPPTLPELSNFRSPPAEPEDFLWIKGEMACRRRMRVSSA